ncbi:hypothetical protein FJM67_06960 [Maribrevibacterium harenarium]|uniref:Reelin domain-containing protein n=1 Tax=Maribrevibacterium harenarium TaxID=2589817 RepID=A0A501WVE3_9GAMM|nr:hypothetical protein [Maribrevibacterium harenarium]TPE53388.1 hypothetical protein FJM67_06960 [Maribrevibacterium harenarium]
MKAFSKLELGFYAVAFASVFGIAALLRTVHSEPPMPDDVGLCDLKSGFCDVQTNNRFDGSQVQFENGININRRIPTTLTLPAAMADAPDDVTLVLEGRDMYLGVYEYPLRRKEGNQWHGKVVIPLCTDNRMQWALKVKMPNKRGELETLWAYQFDIDNPNALAVN